MNTNARQALLNLSDALVDDILSMSDDELLAECEPGELEETAKHVRAIFEAARKRARELG